MTTSGRVPADVSGSEFSFGYVVLSPLNPPVDTGLVFTRRRQPGGIRESGRPARRFVRLRNRRTGANAEFGMGQRGSLVERAVWPVPVLVGLVLGKHGSEVSLVEDE